jgi:hypothetical protein
MRHIGRYVKVASSSDARGDAHAVKRGCVASGPLPAEQTGSPCQTGSESAHEQGIASFEPS